MAQAFCVFMSSRFLMFVNFKRIRSPSLKKKLTGGNREKHTEGFSNELGISLLTFFGLVVVIVGSLRGDVVELRGQSKIIFEKILDDFLNTCLTCGWSIRDPSGSNFGQFIDNFVYLGTPVT